VGLIVLVIIMGGRSGRRVGLELLLSSSVKVDTGRKTHMVWCRRSEIAL